MAFSVPPLTYAYDALEPHIDEQTMRIHHDKHHDAYVGKLNDAVAGTDLESQSIESILSNLGSVPDGKARRGAEPGRRPRQPHAVLDRDRPQRRRRPLG